MCGKLVMKPIPVVVYPLPWSWLVPACGPPASFSVHLASSAVTPAGSVHKSRVTMWCVCGCSWRDDVYCVCECYKRGIVVMDVIWPRVRQGSISSELLMCCGGVHNILLLPLMARCLETIYVCTCRMFVFMSVVVTVWGLWECLLCIDRC